MLMIRITIQMHLYDDLWSPFVFAAFKRIKRHNFGSFVSCHVLLFWFYSFIEYFYSLSLVLIGKVLVELLWFCSSCVKALLSKPVRLFSGSCTSVAGGFSTAPSIKNMVRKNNILPVVQKKKIYRYLSVSVNVNKNTC